MISNYPLLLVAKKEYLESFQQGKFFMKNCLYYQSLEDDDLQRSDKYDSALKCGYDEFGIPKEVKEITRNPRLVLGDSYIKCFFAYSKENIIDIFPNRIAYFIPPKSQEALIGFSEEYALIIDKYELINRFSKFCEEYNYKYYFSDVNYLESTELEEKKNQIVESVLNRSNTNLIHPTFYKDSKYSAQQEFRFCVTKKFELNKTQSFNNLITGTVNYNDSITLDLGKLDDISTLVKLKDLIDYPVIYDNKKKEHFIYCSDLK